MRLIISKSVRAKLQSTHSVSEHEVVQCFMNRDGRLLQDTREQHRTNPPTQWFVADTDKGRTLKIVFVTMNACVHLKSAFEPNQTELDIYSRHGKHPQRKPT